MAYRIRFLGDYRTIEHTTRSSCLLLSPVGHVEIIRNWSSPSSSTTCANDANTKKLSMLEQNG
jgi:hypothetical protein